MQGWSAKERVKYSSQQTKASTVFGEVGNGMAIHSEGLPTTIFGELNGLSNIEVQAKILNEYTRRQC
jgi:hypothetical protein